jgi:hypothetical protein
MVPSVTDQAQALQLQAQIALRCSKMQLHQTQLSAQKNFVAVCHLTQQMQVTMRRSRISAFVFAIRARAGKTLPAAPPTGGQKCPIPA